MDQTTAAIGGLAVGAYLIALFFVLATKRAYWPRLVESRWITKDFWSYPLRLLSPASDALAPSILEPLIGHCSPPNRGVWHGDHCGCLPQRLDAS